MMKTDIGSGLVLWAFPWTAVAAAAPVGVPAAGRTPSSGAGSPRSRLAAGQRVPRQRRVPRDARAAGRTSGARPLRHHAGRVSSGRGRLPGKCAHRQLWATNHYTTWTKSALTQLAISVFLCTTLPVTAQPSVRVSYPRPAQYVYATAYEPAKATKPAARRAQPAQTLVPSARPTVTITTTEPPPVAAEPFPITITFSAPVTGVELSDLIVGNGIASDLEGQAATYTATVFPADSGTVTVDIPAGAAVDSVGNPSSAALPFSIAADTAPPTVTITTTDPAPVRGPFSITVAFSEPVTGFRLRDLLIVNGIALDLEGQGATYTATVTPADSGTVTVDIPAGAALDSAANFSAAALPLSIAADTTPPTVTITTTDPAPVRGQPFSIVITFSEPVTGFQLNDLTVENGAASELTPASYTATVTPAESGNLTIDIAAQGARDRVGNPMDRADSFSIEVDRTLTQKVLTFVGIIFVVVAIPVWRSLFSGGPHTDQTFIRGPGAEKREIANFFLIVLILTVWTINIIQISLEEELSFWWTFLMILLALLTYGLCHVFKLLDSHPYHGRHNSAVINFGAVAIGLLILVSHNAWDLPHSYLIRTAFDKAAGR